VALEKRGVLGRTQRGWFCDEIFVCCGTSLEMGVLGVSAGGQLSTTPLLAYSQTPRGRE